MSEQPEALRLAAELQACPTINYKDHAAELRRLHAVNQELLEALKLCAVLVKGGNRQGDAAIAAARAAIAKAEGQA
jgi:hypothetical protein